jgi:2-keto-3-deoxy-L-rhamnonate aldolase RhmA
MRPNQVKQRLLAGQVQVGLMMMSAEPHVAGVTASAGFDFVMADMEHTPLSLRELDGVVRAADAAGIVPMTRAAGSTKADLLAVLETGVRGVMVPAVETAEEAAAIVAAARYGPMGRRGVYYLGYGSEYGAVPVHEYFASANAEGLLILQIETCAGLENAREIAAVPGYDCLLIGPGDLSMSLGVPWEFDHPALWEGIRTTFAAAATEGKIAGIMPPGVDHARRSVEAGARLLLWGPELLLLQRAAREDAAALRAAIPWG